MPSSNLKQTENSEKMEDETEEGSKGGLLGLPESDTELDVRFMITVAMRINPEISMLLTLPSGSRVHIVVWF